MFYSFFWLLLLNLWYWLGWLRRAVLPRLAGGEKLLRRGRALAAVPLACCSSPPLAGSWPGDLTGVGGRPRPGRRLRRGATGSSRQTAWRCCGTRR